jgi:hypothetical protein
MDSKIHLAGLTTPFALSSDFATDATELEQLRINAGAVGDQQLVDTCTKAIAGDTAALAICNRILADSAVRS